LRNASAISRAGWEPLQVEAASSASFAMVLMFRAVPFAAIGILSFERPMPSL